MNAAHLHLLVNHFPVVGVIVGLLVMLSGYVTKNKVVKRTALGIFVFAALLAIPAFLSGEGAEEIVEELPGINEDSIEKHESLASFYIWMIGALGAAAFITFLATIGKVREAVVSTLFILTLLVSIFAAVLSINLGITGGAINHPEISIGAPSQEQEESD